ncbi:hypothetical protein BAE44_0007570 [Dichanthelium oligosanthes]|uniref:Uncharacterized protein n=1 Tax=Dichanthelium oligosanthes TaxID=888268 RepID=A0A1E5W220_9POAL|nr:hypothetical protein BAE44_0007570 [Dichanthelium oligosanthes]
MGALCLLFPSTPPSCPCGAGAARSSLPILAATLSPSSPSSAAAAATRLRLGGRSRGRAGVARVGGGGEGEGAKDRGAAAFFGEDGVVEDMDGYLDYLSLEYDSVWDTKPAWSVCYSVWLLIRNIVSRSIFGSGKIVKAEIDEVCDGTNI